MEETSYILTAEMDPASFTWLDALRREHFPPERNKLSAHLTMFHRLSGEQVDCFAAIPMPSAEIGLHFCAVRFLGSGVAFSVRSPELEHVRCNIAKAIGGELSRQDSQKWTPHVTVQNKASANAAKDLFKTLQKTFTPRDGCATGLLVWEYLGGPWKLVRRHPFQASDSGPS